MPFFFVGACEEHKAEADGSGGGGGTLFHCLLRAQAAAGSWSDMETWKVLSENRQCQALVNSGRKLHDVGDKLLPKPCGLSFGSEQWAEAGAPRPIEMCTRLSY